MERVTRAVDDGLQQLVPRPGRGREPGDSVDEAELIELIALTPPAGRVRRPSVGTSLATLVDARALLHHAHHLTRVGSHKPGEGCRGVAAGLRYHAVALPPVRAAA